MRWDTTVPVFSQTQKNASSTSNSNLDYHGLLNSTSMFYDLFRSKLVRILLFVNRDKIIPENFASRRLRNLVYENDTFEMF